MQIGIGMPTAQTSDEIKATVGHGLARLPSVTLRAYNAELRDGDQFLGDRATNRAFRAILDEWRTRLKKVGKDPLGDTPTSELSKKTLDKILVEGEPEAAGVILSALEEFASELVTIVDRFLKQKSWKDLARPFIPSPILSWYRHRRGSLVAVSVARPQPARARMEMYTVPKAQVLELIATSGCHLVDAIEDTAAGPGYESWRYCMVKR